jgi:predicted Fe-Mo cluster-binding NifX family protein
MKIAIASENGETISRHFGRATEYIIVNTDDRNILGREIRPKVGHTDCSIVGLQEHDCGCAIHTGGVSIYDRHRSMVLNILDCSILLAGGMGWGAYEGLKSRGIKTVITDVEDFEDAVKLYLVGNLPNLMERLH